MQPPTMRDLPSFKKILDEHQQIQAIRDAMPFLRPFLESHGVDTDKLDALWPQFEELAQQVMDSVTVFDRFNALFAGRGWVIYERMDTNVAKAAIQKADAGDYAGAEQVLVEYFSPTHVARFLPMMVGVRAFKARMPLAQKALTDYSEGRYHACVPVVLALLDGMVNEITGKYGFFAKGVSLTAWDSIAGHDSGLKELARMMTEKRTETTVEALTVPYRHGIMHGMDLAYDNEVVAAKAWAALFAAREWALRAQRGELDTPPEQPPKTLAQSWQEYRESMAESERVRLWQPRMTADLAYALHTALTSSDLEPGSPERRLAEFLELWRQRNYGRMVAYIGRNPPKYFAKPVEAVRGHFSGRELREFIFRNITDMDSSVTLIDVRVQYLQDGQEVEQVFQYRLINEDPAEQFVARGNPGGEWFVVNWQQ